LTATILVKREKRVY